MNNVKLLNSVRKIGKQVSRKASSNNLVSLSFIVREDKQKLDKSLSETKAHLKKFCLQKSIGFMNNENINESCLGKKKLYPGNNGEAAFAKNLMGYMNWVD